MLPFPARSEEEKVLYLILEISAAFLNGILVPEINMGEKYSILL